MQSYYILRLVSLPETEPVLLKTEVRLDAEFVAMIAALQLERLGCNIHC